MEKKILAAKYVTVVRRVCSWRLAVVLGLCLMEWVFGISAGAATITWTNLNGGAWSVAANWSPHSVPGTFDDVSITSAGTYTVMMDVSPSISSLTLGGASGVQTLTNSNQTLTVSHASAVNVNGVLSMGNGTVNGTGSLAVSGLMNWNGGSSGNGFSITVTSGAVLNLQASVTFAGVVTNLGTVNWQAGNVALNTNGVTGTGEFWNQAGALFDIQCNQSLSSASTLATFHNVGLVRKEITSNNTTFFSVFLDNSGTFQAKSGTILIPSGSNLGGIFQADSGAIINFNSGTFVLSSPPNFQGPGVVQFTGGNMTLNGFTGTFTLNGITLVGQNTVVGTINLNGSNLGNGATLTVLSNAVLNLQASVTFAGVVTNLGTVNWQAGNVALNTNGVTGTGEFWNEAGALFDIQCNQSLSSASILATFHNVGVVRKEIASNGTTFFSVFLDNSGTFQAKSGTILIPSGSNLGGIFQADSGAVINFNSGTFVLSSPPNFQGPGVVQFTGGNMTLNGFTGTFTLNGITLVGQNTVVATGTINLNGSNLGNGATLTVLSNAVLNLQASVTFAGVVTNLGTVNWQAGNVALDTNGVSSTGEFWNQAGALFDIQCNQSLSSASTLATFHNVGLVRKEITSNNTTFFSVFLDNSGTFQAKSGTILIPSGSNLGGIFQADSGAVINFNSGAFVLSSPPNFQGPGVVQFTGGNMTLNGFTGAFTLNGITLVGQNTVVATGTINLNGSNLGNGATLTVLSNAVLNLEASVTFAGVVTNLGTVNWQAGNVALNTNGVTGTGEFWNQAGALFDIQCNQSLSSSSTPATFHNAGTIRKSAGTASAVISVNLNNTGTIQAQIGVIGIQGAYTESSTATLAISLSGISPGTGFGKIQFTAAPTFAGKFTLNTLNGYRPNPGDSFLVISYPSFAGGFTSLNGLDLGGGLQLAPQMSATSLTLVASGHVPTITRLSLSGTNAVLNCANGLSGGIYVVLTSTNLTRPLSQWSAVATNLLVADGNFTLTATNAVNPGMRQRFFVIQLQ